MLAYHIILSIAVAGMMQAHWGSAVAGGCVLALLTLVERGNVAASPSNLQGDVSTASAFALGNAAATATAAFAVGRASAWLWGL